ncbi:MAG: hypothetical protein EOP83_33960, partial [Verrucomicrobiaceae bacterium]
MARVNVARRPWAKFLPWAVLLVCLATTASLYFGIGRTRARRNGELFDQSIARLTKELKTAVRGQIGVLHAVSGVYATKPDINRKDFGEFYRELSIGNDAKLSTVLGISLARPWSQRADLRMEAKKRGATTFKFRPLEPREEAHAIILAEPWSNTANQAAIGYDMHSEPIRKKAIDRSRQLRKTTVTSKVNLIQD